MKSSTEPEVAEEPAGGGWVAEESNGASLPELASVIQAERVEREKREREQLVRARAAAGGNKAVAARALGLARAARWSARLKEVRSCRERV